MLQPNMATTFLHPVHCYISRERDKCGPLDGKVAKRFKSDHSQSKVLARARRGKEKKTERRLRLEHNGKK